MTKWTRILYLIFAWLFPLTILVQVLFVGLSLFTGQPYWSNHVNLGHTIVVLPLLMVIFMYPARLPRATKTLTWISLGVCLVQTEVFAIIRGAVPALAAFHPVLALILFALAVIVAFRSRTYGQATVILSAPAKQSTLVEQQTPV